MARASHGGLAVAAVTAAATGVGSYLMDTFVRRRLDGSKRLFGHPVGSETRGVIAAG